jgi:F0F1-type ATP synthase membrane subunit a
LNTTLVLALITVITFLGISLKYVWVWKTLKWYIFNFTWTSFSEKIINVFVWWLHFLSIPSTIASLSLRLFGNIFAWVVLLWVIGYLWVFMSENFFEVWRVLSIPFWFFEIFVAFIQAIVFMGLMVSYFKQNKVHH